MHGVYTPTVASRILDTYRTAAHPYNSYGRDLFSSPTSSPPPPSPSPAPLPPPPPTRDIVNGSGDGVGGGGGGGGESGGGKCSKSAQLETELERLGKQISILMSQRDLKLEELSALKVQAASP